MDLLELLREEKELSALEVQTGLLSNGTLTGFAPAAAPPAQLSLSLSPPYGLAPSSPQLLMSPQDAQVLQEPAAAAAACPSLLSSPVFGAVGAPTEPLWDTAVVVANPSAAAASSPAAATAPPLRKPAHPRTVRRRPHDAAATTMTAAAAAAAAATTTTTTTTAAAEPPRKVPRTRTARRRPRRAADSASTTAAAAATATTTATAATATATATAAATAAAAAAAAAAADPAPARVKLPNLRVFATRVCALVEAASSRTTYREVAAALVTQLGARSETEQENVRRRVYDTLNVLAAVDFIEKEEDKTVRWVDRQRQQLHCARLRELLHAEHEQVARLRAVHSACDHLLRRNRAPPTAAAADTPHLALPFLLLSAPAPTQLSLDASPDRRAWSVRSDQPFALCDTDEVLVQLGEHWRAQGVVEQSSDDDDDDDDDDDAAASE